MSTTLLACGEKRTIRASYDLAAHRVGFVFGDADGRDVILPLDYLEVVTCLEDSAQGPSTNVMWRIESATKPNIVKTSQVVYGEVPDGARATVEARPMEPGCYWVRDSAARYRFRLHEGGGAFSGYGDFLATDPVYSKKPE